MKKKAKKRPKREPKQRRRPADEPDEDDDRGIDMPDPHELPGVVQTPVVHVEETPCN